MLVIAELVGRTHTTSPQFYRPSPPFGGLTASPPPEILPWYCRILLDSPPRHLWGDRIPSLMHFCFQRLEIMALGPLCLASVNIHAK